MSDEAKPADHRETIVFDYDLDEAPDKVWRALTEPALVTKWLAPDARIACEVLEADPERRLSYRWRDSSDERAPLDSIVTFEVTPTPAGGSHLRLVHSDFALVAVGTLAVAMQGPANDNLTRMQWSLSWAA